MRKKHQRALSLLLLLSLLLSLCGCGKGKQTDAAEGTEGTETTPFVSAAEASDFPMRDNDVIAAHRDANGKLVPENPDRDADSFRLYLTNNETMEGFVNYDQLKPYQASLQSIFDTARDQYEAVTAYGLNKSGSGWQEEGAMDAALLSRAQGPAFYTGKAMSNPGPLNVLFQQEEPFQKDALTVIVSNFVEPNFDLNALSVGIEEYLDSYAHSSAYILGIRSEFSGKMYVPSMNRSSNTFYIDNLDDQNYAVNAPFYVVIVGSTPAVEAYYQALKKNLEIREVEHVCNTYSNSVYEQEIAQALSFEVLRDQKAKRAYPTVMSSYNTGSFQAFDNNSLCAATYAGVETVDAAGSRDMNADQEETQIPVRRSTQIALLSYDYNSAYEYTYDWDLYEYDEANDDWLEAGKNAEDQVLCELKKVSAEGTDLVDQINDDLSVTLLTAGREEYYLAAKLNFDNEELLSRNKTYRLEIRITLNQMGGQAAGQTGGSFGGLLGGQFQLALPGSEDASLEGFNIPRKEYYDAVDMLGSLAHGNKTWSSNPQIQPDVAEVLAKTPNLEVLLDRLTEVEDKYQDNEAVVQYIDLLFNLSDKKTGR